VYSINLKNGIIHKNSPDGKGAAVVVVGASVVVVGASVVVVGASVDVVGISVVGVSVGFSLSNYSVGGFKRREGCSRLVFVALLLQSIYATIG
jgi:hypothetical protein